jgi:hypothetical protein
MDAVTFITEPLLDPDFVQFENHIQVWAKLAQKFDVSVASPSISEPVRKELKAQGIRPLDGGRSYMRPRHSRDEIPSFAQSWAQDSILRSNGRTMRRLLEGRRDFVVNISMTTAYPSDIWYVQSPPLGLDAMSRGVDGWLSLAFTVGRGPVELIDSHHLNRSARLASRIYSSTHWVGQYYRQRGMPLRGVLPNYYNSDLAPSTENPSRNYLLGYLGKETDSSALKLIMESGLPLKLFGSKSPGFVRKLTSRNRPANVEVLGRVSWTELRDLYSNAAFTVFPFTDEPFGLVPLESMACGTPVLTYDTQGPSETVIDGRTGWLVSSAADLLAQAKRLFHNGYPPWMATACVERARRFSVDRIARAWEELLRAALNDEEDPPSMESLDFVVGSHAFATRKEPPAPIVGHREGTRPVVVDWQATGHSVALAPGHSHVVGSPDSGFPSTINILRPEGPVDSPASPTHPTDQTGRVLTLGGEPPSSPIRAAETGRWNGEGPTANVQRGFRSPESSLPQAEPSMAE